MSEHIPQDESSAASDPLWPLTTVLAEIATRIARHCAAEHAATSTPPDDEHPPGNAPGRFDEAA